MMQLDRYRKVSCQIWLDQKFLSLSDDGKLVFLLILTHPNLTSFGAMKASPASLTDELGWLTERLSEAFQEVLAKGLAKYDQSARLLMLCNFMKHNKPASPNVVTSWLQGYKCLPECDLKDELFHTLKDYAEGLSEGFREAFRKSFGKAVGIQGTGNREQGAENKSKAKATAPDGATPVKKPSKPKKHPIPADFAISDTVHAWATKNGHGHLERRLEHFVNLAQAKGYEYANWDAAFRNAIEGDWAKIGNQVTATPVDSWAGRDI